MAPVTRSRFTRTDLEGARCALYVRVSKGRKGQKSTREQEIEGRAWAEDVGAVVGEVYNQEDTDRTASRFRTQERAEFERLLDDVAKGRWDVIWFWEASRSNRDLDVFVRIRAACRTNMVLVAVDDHVYDLVDYQDAQQLAQQAIADEAESEKTSKRISRHKRLGAKDGHPPGKLPYGYVRGYEVGTDGKRVLVSQEPDPTTAPIVEDIFARYANGESIASIRKDLNRREIPPPRTAERWTDGTISSILKSPTYRGAMVHQGKEVELPEGTHTLWPALVDDDVWWACQRARSERQGVRHGRLSTRGQVGSLLSYRVRCAECGAKMVRSAPGGKRRYNSQPQYICHEKACAAVTVEALDDYVEAVLVGWLSNPATLDQLIRADESGAAAQARTEAAQARLELKELHGLAETGGISPTGYAKLERSLLDRIADADQRAQANTIPTVLQGKIGPQALRVWEGLDLATKREIVRQTADIRVRKQPVSDRRLAHDFTDPETVRRSWERAREVGRTQAAWEYGVGYASLQRYWDRLDLGPPIGHGGYRPGGGQQQAPIDRETAIRAHELAKAVGVLKAAQEVGVVAHRLRYAWKKYGLPSNPVGRPGAIGDVEGRVVWRWLIGPDAN